MFSEGSGVSESDLMKGQMKMCLLTTALLKGDVSTFTLRNPFCTIIKREENVIIHTSDPHIPSTALRNTCLHIRRWVMDFKQLWECVCVWLSQFAIVSWISCVVHSRMCFSISLIYVCEFVCILTPHFHLNFCVYRFFWLCSLIIALCPWHSPPPPRAISHLCSFWLLQVKTCCVCDADKGDSSVRTVDLDLYWRSSRLCFALLLNFYGAFTLWLGGRSLSISLFFNFQKLNHLVFF